MIELFQEGTSCYFSILVILIFFLFYKRKTAIEIFNLLYFHYKNYLQALLLTEH